MGKLTKAQIFAAKCEYARRSFFGYCELKAPDFYKEERSYIVNLCNTMQNFFYSDKNVLVVNMPPRTGKSRTAQLFVEWILGKDQKQKIMTGSYNEMLSTTFAKSVRNSIQEIKADEYIPVYTDVFKNVKIKAGDGAMNLWSLEGGHNNYLATSPSASATGFGASLIIIDDVLKNAKEAYNDIVKNEQWRWFTDTMLSRLEQGGKMIFIMTRWATNDLAGRVIEHFKEQGREIEHINFKAKNDDGSMLCDDILNAEEYEFKRRLMGNDIFMANYQQEPIDLKGCLYSSLKSYTDIPRDERGNCVFENIKCYTDTADVGSDYLCAIIYGVYQKEAYIIDIVFTNEAMEITEPLLAQKLIEHEVKIADIESNNGGRGFARNIERILKEKYSWNRTKIQWFHQGGNKKARILSNSTAVMEHVYFPVNWADKWPKFYDSITKYQREGRNEHDDAEDALTGVVEKLAENRRMTINSNLIARGGRW